MTDLVTPATAIMLREMLKDPRAKYYGTGLSATLEMPVATVRPLLARLHKAGWLATQMEKDATTKPRLFYTFTARGQKFASAELQTWEFTDA